MAQDKPQGLTPLSLDQLDSIIGGAGGPAPGPARSPHKDDPAHTAYDAAIAAAASVAHTEAGYALTVHGTAVQIPHPPGGDALQTLQAAAAHLDQLHAQVSGAAAQSAVEAPHSPDVILGKAWTQGH